MIFGVISEGSYIYDLISCVVVYVFCCRTDQIPGTNILRVNRKPLGERWDRTVIDHNHTIKIYIIPIIVRYPVVEQ